MDETFTLRFTIFFYRNLKHDSVDTCTMSYKSLRGSEYLLFRRVKDLKCRKERATRGSGCRETGRLPLDLREEGSLYGLLYVPLMEIGLKTDSEHESRGGMYLVTIKYLSYINCGIWCLDRWSSLGLVSS